MARLTDAQAERYSRQIILPEVGGAGQKRLLGGRVAVVGAGGLGSPVIAYLAAAGVGTLDLIDSDVVELNNLQRQIIHSGSTVGAAKVESARETVAQLNPDVTVHAHAVRLTSHNARALLGDADVVVDGSDNFPTRYLVNDACHLLRKPLVSGAIFQFEGQATTFLNDGGPDTPCYRCLFPEMPPAGMIPTCREAGILGAVAGIIGSMQAAEVLKLLLGQGSGLAGKLLLLDARSMETRSIRLRRDPFCVLNGDAPILHELIDQAEAPCEWRP
jgi:adenylyltransferase/sulfurtransferase